MTETTPAPVTETPAASPAPTLQAAAPTVSATQPAVKRVPAKRTNAQASSTVAVKSTKPTKPAVAVKTAQQSKLATATRPGQTEKSKPAKPQTSKIPATAAMPVKAAKPGKTASLEKSDKSDKPKKPKLVRDSFTIPKSEYLALDELKARSIDLARPTKKSELLRAGLMALKRMSNSEFLAALAQVPPIKTGRPKTQTD